MCHSGETPAAGLRLDPLEGVLKGGAKGAIVKGGAPDASELVRRVRGQARPRMPFDGPPYRSPEDTQLIVDWIAQGARNAAGTASPPVPAHTSRSGDRSTPPAA
jgi:hypothetical protein